MALIYIVEDDESIREIETIALKNSNYIVSAFENAKEFYKKLDELVPDLILLDVMLPDIDGFTLRYREKAQKTSGHTGYSYYNGHSQDHRDGYDKRA
mgnify:CR=1 FL=1